MLCLFLFFFFFKQKTAYEMRISDWSSDVCSSDLDLTAWGSFLFMGLIGIIIASLVNLFIQSSALQFAVSVIGVLVFVGLTAYDTQKKIGRASCRERVCQYV